MKKSRTFATTRQLTNNDKLALKLAPGGGACLVIKKNPSMRVCEQATFPLVSPSGKMNADIKVGGEECRNRFICQ